MNDARRVLRALVIVTSALLASCGGGGGSGGGGSTPPAIGVSILPGAASVQAGIGTQSFTPTVTNTANTAVTWQVNGVTGGDATVGTIDANGLYTAPAGVPSPANVTVRAVSVADPTKSGPATVTVTAPVAVTVQPPGPVALQAGTGTQQFAATVTHAANTAVTWQVNGVTGGNATVGTITAGGLYTAPASVPSPATVTVTAVSVADPARSGSAQATVTSGGGAVSVTVAPRRAGLTTGQPQQFQSTVTGTANTAVTWSVDGVAGGNASVGTVSAAGLYAPPTTAGTHTVTATSVASPGNSASAAVAVTDLAGITTQRYDSQRTGQNVHEYALTPATLATAGAFGKRYTCAVDGPTYAQPLWVANLAIGGGTHNVVFVATEHDSVYAFDADASPCVTLWHRTFLVNGATPVPAADTGETGDIPNELGITGTPVIDPVAKVLYVLANTKESGSYVYRLHALDLATGNEKSGSPVTIQASVATFSQGTISFDPLAHLQRPGLLLLNGKVYVAFGSHGDSGTYYGWLLGYDAASLAQAAVYDTTPDGSQCAIWMSGTGPAADAAGNIYLSTANGSFNNTANTLPPMALHEDFGDTVLRLDTSAGLVVHDFFTPNNQDMLNLNDWDLGAGGVLVLPDALGSGAHPHLAITGDKEAKLFLIDRDNMGKYGSVVDANVQTVTVNNQGGCVTCGIFSTPSVWGNRLYVVAINDALKIYNVAGGLLQTTPASQGGDVYGYPGSNTVVSASGASNGVVWALDTNASGTGGRAAGPAILRAYDATNAATRLWSSGAQAGDAAGNAVKFSVPTVANGKVYVGGASQLTVYGLAP